MTEIENGEPLKYADIAPLVSKHIAFADIPTKHISKPMVIRAIKQKDVEDVIASDENPSKLAVQLGLSKGQVMKIRKEYEAAIRHKSHGGGE